MKIEPNRFYKTRCGLKARIYAVDGTQIHSYENIHGAVFAMDGWFSKTWCKDGSYGASEEGLYDLISEWGEPKPKLKAYIYSGNIYFPEDCENVGHMKRAPWLDEP